MCMGGSSAASPPPPPPPPPAAPQLPDAPVQQAPGVTQPGKKNPGAGFGSTIATTAQGLTAPPQTTNKQTLG